ncbi:lys-63-specific deubiquitinase BRCC36-like isoform X1 [Abrus precatorius]|uniref:Lys-63-specific deubiquitinase BRCC36-like isoform X1 n=1 Tax=Abrus precatorius TaxID=3816 RepID=A0A8B8KFD0_ABRPR|nr:lys-63-specific deubiquitinase BRCC36-like isoform X1 [Abrus precatorius]
MSLTSVKMSEEVWLTCVTHALSTETEEIMGLLLGDIQHSKNGAVTALIWGASPQTRSDRRKDRVETNPEQLAAASALADRMTASTGRTTRVIGWYHSHPHITVLPSHVDVRTQAMYQLLDSGFIGLIFSCYSEDVNKVGRIQVIAFQSSDGKQNQLSRPIPLSPVNRTSVIDIDSSPSSSENVSIRSGYFKAESPELDTGDSRTVGASKGGGRPSDLGNFFANADANYLGREKGGENYHLNNSDTNIIDVDPMDMSESMQEAMHRSNLDVSGAEFVRREIPLYVLPALSLINLDSPLLSYKDLQHVLFEEERAAYNQAILQNMRDGKVHPLTFIHHTSTYQASLCKLIEYCLSPAISVLQDRLRENETRLAVLSEEAKSLEAEAYRGSEASLGSPRQVASPVHRGGSSPGLRNLHSSGESLGSRNVGSPGSRSRKGY